MQAPITIYLGLGTNLGDRRTNLQRALELLRQRVGTPIRTASLYRTPAWGVTDQPDFFNTVAELETTLSAEKVLREILNIENEMGRIRTRRWGERLIDIDLLLYGEQIIELPHLIVPHPFLVERNFVLAPLADLAPDLRHPVHRRTIRQLLADSPDTAAVTRLK